MPIRESFHFDGWPVEAFVHDPETLDYFFQHVDARSGVPSLATMVAEGTEIPSPSAFSDGLKKIADSVLAKGPPAWSKADIDRSRYMISTTIDDLKEPRSRAEQMASAAALYGALANHYFRRQGLWSAKEKAIPRRLCEVDAPLAVRFTEAFDTLFRTADSTKVAALTEELLSPDGGLLFAGYTAPAPAEWR
jgi:hypothetical protein